MGSQGNGYGYNNLTFADNEERSIYEPLHVQKGFQPSDSAVNNFLRLPLDHVLFGFCASNTGASTFATCWRVSASRRHACCSIHSPPGNFLIAAASTPNKNSSALFTKPPKCRPAAIGICNWCRQLALAFTRGRRLVRSRWRPPAQGQNRTNRSASSPESEINVVVRRRRSQRLLAHHEARSIARPFRSTPGGNS